MFAHARMRVHHGIIVSRRKSQRGVRRAFAHVRDVDDHAALREVAQQRLSRRREAERIAVASRRQRPVIVEARPSRIIDLAWPYRAALNEVCAFGNQGLRTSEAARQLGIVLDLEVAIAAKVIPVAALAGRVDEGVRGVEGVCVDRSATHLVVDEVDRNDVAHAVILYEIEHLPGRQGVHLETQDDRHLVVGDDAARVSGRERNLHPGGIGAHEVLDEGQLPSRRLQVEVRVVARHLVAGGVVANFAPQGAEELVVRDACDHHALAAVIGALQHGDVHLLVRQAARVRPVRKARRAVGAVSIAGDVVDGADDGLLSQVAHDVVVIAAVLVGRAGRHVDAGVG